MFYANEKPDRGSTSAPDHIMLSISGDAKTSMTVSWRSSAEIPAGYVLLREAGKEDWRRAEAASEVLRSDIDVSRFYWAALTGLHPGTQYEYTVGSADCRGGPFFFETEPENLTRFRFLLLSDPQQNQPWDSPSYETPRRVIRQALAAYPDIRFLLSCGDNCDNGQNELQWNGMFSGLAGIIEGLPWMMATGNHDNRGYLTYLPEPLGKFYLEHADFFDAQFARSYPQNGPEGYRGENYSFDYGSAHFTVLGINAPETVADWAYEDLRHTRQRWKLGVYHFPLYPLMPEGENGGGFARLRKPIEQGRLDVLFSGHAHAFARTFPLLRDELFDRPSQGVVHYTVGNAGRNSYISNARKVWHSAYYQQEEPLSMVCLAEIDGDRLTVTALLEDGRTADFFRLDKTADEIFPPALPPVFRRPRLAFKGDLLELGARGVAPQEREDRWFVPAGPLIQHIGGTVTKEPGRVTVTAYDRTAQFSEGSAAALVDGAAFPLTGTVFRGDRGQLYTAAEDLCVIFGMEYQYAARNNYLNFDHPSENIVLSAQP
ncbi:MAG: fibronectin type III domain-containing protein [Oscillospiraceae bacterium]|jgi:hypothetical protein|nr:fibronectin type III domain-containing protein [Oscillospiraceae bacterium]